jgi:two-component system response regulator AtoC
VIDRPIGVEDLADRLSLTPGPDAPAPQDSVSDEPDSTSSTAELGALSSLAEASRDFERQKIEDALRATSGNKTHAARLLGVPLRTFMKKVKRHGL